MAAARTIPVGLQLYSVRNECARDLPDVLRQVAAMGYEGVEFAGYHDRSAADLRKMLDDRGLKCCGSHLRHTAVIGDELERTIEFNRILGNRYLVVASFPKEFFASRQAVLNGARILAEASIKAKAHGMLVGYHNHAIEFAPVEGQIPWDIIAANTPRDVILQLDIGNGMGGGADPVAFLSKYPGRGVTVHLKEYTPKGDCLPGDGQAPWKQVLDLCRGHAGTEWLIVEQTHSTIPALQWVRQSLERIRPML